MKKALVVLVALLTLAASSAYALTEAQSAAAQKAFNKVPATEIAAKAATLVKSTPAADRKDMAVALTRAAIAKNPNVASAVVSSISAVAPEVSPAISAAASAMLRSHAEMIASAATTSAPQYSEQITASVSAAVPSAAATVTKTRVSENSAVTATGTPIVIVPGPIRGVQYTPVVPPASTPSANIQVGYDPNRYSSPAPAH